MIGCRSLTTDEIDLVRDKFDNIINDEERDKNDLFTRNKTIFFVGLYSGFRISELLSLKLGDVWKYGRLTDSVYLKRENTKKKFAGRTGVINNNCKQTLEDYIIHYKMMDKDPKSALFFSTKGGHLQPRQVQKIYKDLFESLEFDGK